MGRRFEFGPHHFSFPPSHLFNFLALLLSSSSGESLTARVVENQYSFRVCACVCVCVCVCGRERETVYVCRRDEREAPGSCVLQLSHRVIVQSCPATAPAQTQALPHDWMIFTSIRNDQARTRLLNIARPPSLSSLSLSPYLPLPITHLFPC